MCFALWGLLIGVGGACNGRITNRWIGKVEVRSECEGEYEERLEMYHGSVAVLENLNFMLILSYIK